jgi:hypothetical protein
MNSKKEPIFIIGYPRSGNTWLARICADVLDAPIVTGDDLVNQADRKRTYKGSFAIHKLHCSREYKPDYVTESSRILYVIRDFRDVLISAYFFIHTTHDERRIVLGGERNFGNRFLRLYFCHQIRRLIKCWRSNELVSLRNLMLGSRNTVGNWSNHVDSWIDFPGIGIVRYEDLLEDTGSAVSVAFEKVRVDWDERRLHDAIERQSFERRKREFAMKGDRRRFLDEKTIRRIRQAHGATMRRQGYQI